MTTPRRFLKRQRNVAILACFSWFLLTGSSAAQTPHPCDTQLPQSVVTSGAPLKIELCARVTDQPEAAIARVDGQAHSLQPITLLTTQTNSQGLALYTTTAFLQVTRGTHQLTVSLMNRKVDGSSQEGAQSSPFGFGVVDDTPVPAAPIVKQVKR